MGDLIGSLKPTEDTKMDGINTDRVTVNAGSGGDGGGMGSFAALAALLGRGEGEGGLASALPLLLADRGHRHDGLGGLGGAALGFIAGALTGRRGGLFSGGDGDGGGSAENRIQDNADTLAVLGAVGNTKDAVTGGFATTALALSQGFAGVKDSVQASTFLLSNQINATNQNVSEQACQTREIVLAAQTAILGALKDNRISELEDRVRALHADGRARETEVNVTQNVNQQQMQQQQQQIVHDRFARLEGLLTNVIGNQFIAARTGQDILNLGTMTASGTQVATNANQK